MMKIEQNKYVSLAYRLTVDGAIVEDVKADMPLDFIFGIGMILPKFESSVMDKVSGDSFAFSLTPEEAYGEYIEGEISDVPKGVFEVNGVFNDEVVAVGAVLPMVKEGKHCFATVIEITDEVVKMDFNHPMAGKTLNFEGEVVGVREATDEDMAKFMPADSGCGCGCSGDDCGDGECGEGECGDKGCC